MLDGIARIGQAHGDPNQLALGMMARGDALKFLGHFQEAWDALEEAGRLFQSTGNELGWARTRIGPLFIAVGNPIAWRKRWLVASKRAPSSPGTRPGNTLSINLGNQPQ